MSTSEPGLSPTFKWMAAGLAAVFAWVLVLATMGPRLDPDGLDPPALEGTASSAPVDFGWTLLDPDDRPVEFSQFKGRPIVLNLWATWCVPCRQEMPSIERLAADPKVRARGVAVVCVSTDESAGALRAFLKEKPWGMTILRATSVPPAFRSDGIPATFVIDPDGRVVASEVGAARWDDPSVVDLLAKMPSPKP